MKINLLTTSFFFKTNLFLALIFTDNCINTVYLFKKNNAINGIIKHGKPLKVSSDDQYSTPERFGAKGDGINDDTKAITDALNSTTPVIIFKKTKAYYKVSNMILISKINKKKLILNRAIILNSDLTKATFLFANAKNIQIVGGEFGYTTSPIANGGNSQHVFQFASCQNILIDKIHIRNSPEMGIAITNCNNVTVQNSLIEHTFRDGTYAHYSANVKYINNKYRNIKDDAMSFHDYGLTSQKTQLNKYGYTQASNLIARNNSVENAYQGFSSIGSTGIEVSNNKFVNTVLAGVAVFNSADIYENSTASANHIKVLNNIINNACGTVTINNVSYENNGQASTGRAAIFIASLGKNNQLNNGETKKLTNVLINNNKIYNSGAEGFFGKDIDQLTFTNNAIYDCSGAVPSKSLAGDVVEMSIVSNLLANNNTVIDRRPKILHQHGYSFNNVSGRAGNWKIKGVLSRENNLNATEHLLPLSQKQFSSNKSTIKKKQ